MTIRILKDCKLGEPGAIITIIDSVADGYIRRKLAEPYEPKRGRRVQPSNKRARLPEGVKHGA